MWQIFAGSVEILVTENKKNKKPCWSAAVIFVLKLKPSISMHSFTDRNFVVFSSQQVLHFDLEVTY